jgi:S-adenosylmethionine decarboxylase
LIELKDCNHNVLNDIDLLRACLRETAERIGATVVNDSFYQFTPYGVSGVVIIAESHLAIHTWPEHNYAAVDVFTCGHTIEPKDAVPILINKLGAKESSCTEISRGVLHGDKVSIN